MIVNSVAYRDGKKIADVAREDIHTYLARNDCIVWVAVRDPEPHELDQLEEQFDLHPLAIEDARHGHQRPKFEEYGDSLFFVMHMIEPDGDELRVGEVNIFVGRNYVLSVRMRSERNFQDVRARCEREPELMQHGTGYILYALMDAVVDRYFPILDSIETQLEVIEEQIFSGKSPGANIEALYGIKQDLMTLKHATAPLLEAVGKLYGGRVPQVCTGLGDYFRDVSDHLVRINQSIDAARDMVTTAISVNLSLITLQESEVTKRLAGYAALVAVPTLIAGIYGMNFQHMPELAWQWGYPLSLAAMAVIDGYLFYRFRKARWL
ncbi:MAG: magnesium and cobalt transport protein CorA [Proteobacteria bacterium]|nr:magnesium and cobalt transport protein CorA [Pseudomonadota bacterium]